MFLIESNSWSNDHAQRYFMQFIKCYVFLAAISMIVACASFPFGWNSDDFRKICGPEANRFDLGLCGIRWAYALAIIGENPFFLY